MKILLVIGALKSGGAERVMSNLANYLSELGDHVTLLSIHNAESVYEISNKVEFVNGLGEKGQIRCIRALHRFILNRKPDIALSFMTHINISLILAAVGTSVPVVVSERNDPKRMPREKSRRLLRGLLYPLARGYVFQTEEAQHHFCKSIQKNSKIIINPCEVQVAPVSVYNRNRDIVTVGRLMPQKNQRMLIQAFAEASKSVPGFKLHIYGEGPLRSEIEKDISKANMKGDIILHGAVKNLHEQIKTSRIFALTSDYEGMPNALMEALSLGLACISTDCPCGGPRSLINNEENGILIPVGDVKCLTKRLTQLMMSEEQCSELGKRALEKSIEFNPSRVYREWRDYLVEVSAR